MERKEFRLNEVIFKDGVYQNWMYSICEGSVDIYSEYATPNEKKLITLTKGQLFGEIGMIAVMPRTATAVAAEDHVVLEQIGDTDFEDYLKNHPDNLQLIMSGLSRRISELTEDLSMVTQITNEALHKKGTENAAARWPMEFAESLLSKIQAKRAAHNEVAILRKRQQALTGEASPMVRFSAGDVIFRAGEQSDCLYDICEGCVGIYSDYQTHNSELLAELCVEEVFGEMGILDGKPRSASAVCLTDCTILVVKPESFIQYFQEKPAKVLQILQKMCIQLRNLTQKYVRVCKTLEEMRPLDGTDLQQDMVIEKLMQIR